FSSTTTNPVSHVNSNSSASSGNIQTSSEDENGTASREQKSCCPTAVLPPLPQPWMIALAAEYKTSTRQENCNSNGRPLDKAQAVSCLQRPLEQVEHGGALISLNRQSFENIIT
ncbi:unnamed protein product, partial [Amoebophrya sp. A120]